MTIEAFKIAVTLKLVENVTAGLGALSRVFRSTGQDADVLQRRLDRIAKTSLAGGALLATGGAIEKMLQGPLDEAKKFEQQVAKFKLYGLGDAVTKEAADYAKGMNIMGSSATENMKLMVEAQGVFRESGLSGSAALEGAKLAAPMLAKIDFATRALDGETRAKMLASAMAMLRFIENQGGLKDAGTFNSIADAGWKAIQTSGGNVNWEQLRQFKARGGVAAQGLSNEALYGEMEPIIGEMKGSTAGNALMTGFNRLIGAVRVPNQVAHLLADNGIWDKSKIVWNSMGGIKAFKGNPLINMDLLSESPRAFYEKIILPMYAKMNNGKGLNQTERNRENLMIFGRTGGAMYSLIDRQLETMHKSVAAQAKALGVDASVNVAGQTLAGREIDYEAKLANLKLELGQKILPIVVPALEGLNSALERMTNFAKEHPALIKWATVGVAVLGGVAMLMGGLTMLAGPLILLGGTASLVIAGIVAAVGVLGAAAIWVHRHTDSFKAAWDKAALQFSGLGDLISKVMARIVAAVDSVIPDWMRNTNAPHNARGSTVPPHNARGGVINTTVNLDGRKVGQAVSNYQAKHMASAPTSGSGFDGRQSLPPVLLPAAP